MSLEVILGYQNLIIIAAIMGVIEALKMILSNFKLLDHIAVQITLPFLPMIFGVLAAFIPGAMEGELGFRIVLGIALGGLSGQVWKIVKTQVDVLKKN